MSIQNLEPVAVIPAPRQSWRAAMAGWEAAVAEGKVPTPPEFPASNFTYTKACLKLAAAAQQRDPAAIEAILARVTGRQTYAALTRRFGEACRQAASAKPAAKPKKRVTKGANHGA